MNSLKLGSLPALVLVAVAACLSGCGAVQTVPVKDDDSAAVAVRATLRPQAWAREGGLPGAGIEVGYEGYRARDTQALAAGEVVSLNGGAITGPDTLRHQANVRQAYVAYNHLFRFGSNFQLEPFVGAARISLKMESESVSSAARLLIDDVRTGVVAGITPRWRFNDWAAVEARLSYFNAGAWVHGQSYEAALVLSPVPHASLRLGYSGRRFDVEDAVPGWFSEVNVRARGPLATLQFSF